MPYPDMANIDDDVCVCGDKRKDHHKHKNIWRGCNKCLCTSFTKYTTGMWAMHETW